MSPANIVNKSRGCRDSQQHTPGPKNGVVLIGRLWMQGCHYCWLREPGCCNSSWVRGGRGGKPENSTALKTGLRYLIWFCPCDKKMSFPTRQSSQLCGTGVPLKKHLFSQNNCSQDPVVMSLLRHYTVESLLNRHLSVSQRTSPSTKAMLYVPFYNTFHSSPISMPCSHLSFPQDGLCELLPTPWSSP